MKKVRKQLCFVLTLVMVFCMFPITSQAAQPPSGIDWEFDENGQLTITSNIGMNDWASNGSGYKGAVTSVVIENAVTAISMGAFSMCADLETVTIGTAVADIGNLAFMGCINLSSLDIPDSVTSIGSGAFQGCSGLTDLTIPNSVTTIGANAFDGCINLGAVTIGNSVTTMGERAFSYCTGLTSLDIPVSVQSIGASAFIGCDNLDSAVFRSTTPPAVGAWIFNSAGHRPNIFVPVNSWTDYYLSDLGDYFHSEIFPQSVAITKNNATTYYPTLTNALTAAQNGDTVTLLSDITESTIYTISADTTVTIDGMGHKVTGVDGTGSAALSISGVGTINLKDITLQGGAGAVSKGLEIAGSVSVCSYGTVAARGGATATSYGLINNGSGTVNVTTAYASATGSPMGMDQGFGVYNTDSGTVNVSSVTGLANIMGGRGVYNLSGGTVNATTVVGGLDGVWNAGSGTVNVGSAEGTYMAGHTGIYNSGAGTVNAGTATATSGNDSVRNSGSGTVNVSTITGTTTNSGVGIINTGTSVAAITLNKGSGATCVLDSITVASTGTTTIGKLPSVYKNGVYSDLWYIDSAKTTLFTGNTVTGATTLYSYFYTQDNGGSGGHGGGGGGGAAVPVKVPEIATTVSGTTATVNIPKAALGQTANGGTDAFKVSTPIASISFDKAALSTIMDAASDIKITVTKVDATSLSEETKQLVGDRPVFDFSVTGGNKTISQFGGTVTVSVPYTPKVGEDPNAIVIYYINAAGKPEVISNCAYDPDTGSITFTTDHFSKYAVGYNKVSFSDVAENAWYGDAVSFVAARDITTGTGKGNFSPMEKLTRGQFLVMVMRAYGIEADTAASDNFSDAGNTYYTGYLAAAKSLGITDGIGNNLFAPKKEITRQEMFTLLYNTLKQIDALPESTTGKKLTSYQDADKIANWAEDAMTLFVGTGTISGSGKQLNPTETTNRAQLAQVLYNLLSK